MGRMKELFGKGFVLPVTAQCSLMLPLSAAQAALVTYSFTGSIPGTAISSETPVSGSFQFDNATGGSGGAYHGAVKDLTVTIGSYTAAPRLALDELQGVVHDPADGSLRQSR